MSWSEEVAFILLEIICDPEIIRYLLSIAKPLHFRHLSDEARLFHESLRMTREKRWALTKELSKQRKFHEMNNRVPITCSLPFNNIEWRTSCELLKSIHFMREGFLRKKFPTKGNHHPRDIDLELPLKIKSINLITEDSVIGSEFRGYFGIKDIREALDDFEMYQQIDNEIEEETPYHELPYIRIEIWCDGVCKSGYSKRIFTLKDNTELFIDEIMN